MAEELVRTVRDVYAGIDPESGLVRIRVGPEAPLAGGPSEGALLDADAARVLALLLLRAADDSDRVIELSTPRYERMRRRVRIALAEMVDLLGSKHG